LLVICLYFRVWWGENYSFIPSKFFVRSFHFPQTPCHYIAGGPMVFFFHSRINLYLREAKVSGLPVPIAVCQEVGSFIFFFFSIFSLTSLFSFSLLSWGGRQLGIYPLQRGFCPFSILFALPLGSPSGAWRLYFSFCALGVGLFPVF